MAFLGEAYDLRFVTANQTNSARTFNKPGDDDDEC